MMSKLVFIFRGSRLAVLAALSNYFKKNYKTFTFDFKNEKFSELKYAQTISKSANLKNYSVQLNEGKVSSYLLNVLNENLNLFHH